METIASARAGVKRPPNLRESVYQMLRNRIQLGEISLDEKLVDQDIARLMNISRMPVREALLQLKSEGALESTSRGFVLKRYTLPELLEAFEVRLLLEPQAAVMASAHVDGAGLAGMKQALSDAARAQATGDWTAFMRGAAAFRKAWLGLVPNRSLVATIERFFDHVQAAHLMTMRDPEVRVSGLACMKELYEAFLCGDGVQVHERMLAHLNATAAGYGACYPASMAPHPAPH